MSAKGLSHVNPLRAFAAFFGFALIILIVFSVQLEANLRVAAGVTSLLVLGAVYVTMVIHPGKWFTFSSGYLLLFGVFHIGLLWQIAVGIKIDPYSVSDLSWIYGKEMGRASLLVGIAVCAFMLVLCVLPLRANVENGTSSTVRSALELTDPAALGLPLLVVGLVLWSFNTVSSGAVLFGGSYRAYLNATAGTSMPFAFLSISFGFALLGASRIRNARRVALVMFIAWAIPAFLIGLRGEVIVPAAAYAVALTRRRSIDFRWRYLLIPIVALSLGSIVRAARVTGFSTASLTAQDFAPLSGLAELGYSIRPVVVVVSWHDAYGEPFVGLGTYLAPFRRALMSNVLGLPTTTIGSDPTVFSSIVSSRVGQIGGSQVAESYRVGGVLGVLAIMSVLAVVSAIVDSWKSTKASDAVAAMLAATLFLWVRNDFTPVPLELALVTASVMFLRLLWLFSPKRSSLGTASSSSCP